MSYEGENYKICTNGHMNAYDALEDMYEENVSKCEDCGAKYAYVFCRDCTNGDDPECPYTLMPNLITFTDGATVYEGSEYIEIAPVKYEICSLGHRHTTEEARYKPLGKLWRKL